MNVKRKGISAHLISFVSGLSDWEILTAISYCSKLLRRSSTLEMEEFEDLCFFFFDSNVEETETTFRDLKDIYSNELSKRHIN